MVIICLNVLIIKPVPKLFINCFDLTGKLSFLSKSAVFYRTDNFKIETKKGNKNMKGRTKFGNSRLV